MMVSRTKLITYTLAALLLMTGATPTAVLYGRASAQADGGVQAERRE